MNADLVTGGTDPKRSYKNVMLYWDNKVLDWGEVEPYPPEIITVKEKWQNFCPGWNVALFSKETAWIFLRDKFGSDVARLFSTCALATMRADFFRVFWAISEGGIYSDLQFVPRREPLFFDASKHLTVVRRPNSGVIINGIFYSKKDCSELKLVAREIIKTVSERKIPCIMHATGPGAWMRTLSRNGMSEMSIINLEELLENFIEQYEYGRSTRGSSDYWKRLQLRMSIYRDPPEKFS